MLEYVLSILAGVVIGAFAGLIPGVHPNLFATLFLTFTFADPFGAAVILVAASVTNSFVSFIPSIFLGAPEGGNELSVLPGHRLLFEGRGYEAVRLTVMGGVVVVVLALVTLPLVAVVLPVLYDAVRPHLHWVLASVLLYAFWKDRSLWPVVVVGLSGALGLLVLDSLDDPLFPMLTGLFGTSGLLYSMRSSARVPPQTLLTEKQERRSSAAGGLAGYAAGALVGVLPGVGASQAAFLVQQAEDSDARKFLIAVGGVTTADAIFSLLALWLIGNPRSGVAVSVSELLGEIGIGEVVALLGVMCVSAGLAAIATLKISGLVVNKIGGVDYKRLNLFVTAGLAALVGLLAGIDGLFVMSISTCIGLVAIASGTRRSYCMGCLLVPTILFFAGV